MNYNFSDLMTGNRQLKVVIRSMYPKSNLWSLDISQNTINFMKEACESMFFYIEVLP